MESKVEIFKTNVSSEIEAKDIIVKLSCNFPHYKINFDLDDCDRILRVESNSEIDTSHIIEIVQQQYQIQVLE